MREGKARLYNLDGTAAWEQSVSATEPLAATKEYVLLQNCAGDRGECTVASYGPTGTANWAREAPRSTPVLGIRGSFSDDDDPPGAGHVLPPAATVPTGARSVAVVQPGEEFEKLATLDDVDLAGTTTSSFFGLTRTAKDGWTIRATDLTGLLSGRPWSNDLWDERPADGLENADPADLAAPVFIDDVLWMHSDDVSVTFDFHGTGGGEETHPVSPDVSRGDRTLQMPDAPMQVGDTFSSPAWRFHADSTRAHASNGADLVVVKSPISTPALFAPAPRDVRRPQGTTVDPQTQTNEATDYRVSVLETDPEVVHRNGATVTEQRYDSYVQVLTMLDHAVLLRTSEGLELLSGRS